MYVCQYRKVLDICQLASAGCCCCGHARFITVTGTVRSRRKQQQRLRLPVLTLPMQSDRFGGGVFGFPRPNSLFIFKTLFYHVAFGLIWGDCYTKRCRRISPFRTPGSDAYDANGSHWLTLVVQTNDVVLFFLATRLPPGGGTKGCSYHENLLSPQTPHYPSAFVEAPHFKYGQIDLLIKCFT